MKGEKRYWVRAPHPPRASAPEEIVMQRTRHRFDMGHRMWTALAEALGSIGLAPRAQLRRIHELAMPIIVNAWIAAIGQPSPTTVFVLGVMAGLGRGLLCQPAIRDTIGASARSAVFAMAALTFQLAVDRQAGPTGASPMPVEKARRPAFVLQKLCKRKHGQAGSGYHFASRRLQCTVQHQSRRAI
jgi:hypothetical protein